MSGGISVGRLTLPGEVERVWRGFSGLFVPSLEEDVADFDGLVAKIFRFGTTLVAADGGRVAGAISFYSNDRVGLEAFVTLLAVAPEWRRRGVGSLLLGRAKAISAESGMRRMRLEVRKDNPSAALFYTRMGFVADGPRGDFESMVCGLDVSNGGDAR